MIQTLEYSAVLTPDGETFLVTFPDIPEAITFGETMDEALFHAIDCLDTALAYMIKEGEDIPEASVVKDGHIVRPSPQVAAKALLYKTAKKAHVFKAELARRLDWKYPQVDRLFNVHHTSHMSQLTAAYAALGKAMVISIDDAHTA